MKRLFEKFMFSRWLEVAVFVIVILTIYGSYRFKRWFNWEVSYNTQVEQQLRPLRNKINALEKRITKLEKENSK